MPTPNQLKPRDILAILASAGFKHFSINLVNAGIKHNAVLFSH